MSGSVINLRGMSESSLQNYLQLRYDCWLGKDTVRVEVTHLEHKLIEMRVYREYGKWYEEPQLYRGNKSSIFQLDEWIIL